MVIAMNIGLSIFLEDVNVLLYALLANTVQINQITWHYYIFIDMLWLSVDGFGIVLTYILVDMTCPNQRISTLNYTQRHIMQKKE